MSDLFSNNPKRNGEYSAKDIEVLEGLEPVRRRPGMYIGGTDEKALHHHIEELAAIGAMKAAGAVAISDDGRPVMNSRVMRRAMEFARSYELPVIDHCEDLNLSAGGNFNVAYNGPGTFKPGVLYLVE